MHAAPPAILDDYWRDVFTTAGLAIGVLGLLATVGGLAYAIKQIRLTKSAADAAKEAADSAAAENRRYFQRYAVSNVHRFFHETLILVDHQSWEMASARLNDVADQTAQIAQIAPDLAGQWHELTKESREWGQTMKRIQSSKTSLQPKKWNDFTMRMRQSIDAHHSPFDEEAREEEE